MEKTVGERIAEMRKKAGLTQKDMAQKLNVSDKSVSRWERDENLPDLYLALDIAKLFGISVDELIGYTGAPVPEAVGAPLVDKSEEKKEQKPRREDNIERALKVRSYSYNVRSNIIRTVPFFAFVIAIAIRYGLVGNGVDEWLVAVSVAIIIDVSALIYQIYLGAKLFFYITELCADVSKRMNEKAVSAKKELTKKAMVTFGIIVTAFVLTVCYLHLGDIVEFIYCALIFAPISIVLCATVSFILWDRLEAKGKFR